MKVPSFFIFGLLVASIFVLSFAQENEISLGFDGLLGGFDADDDDFSSELNLDCQNPPAEPTFLPRSNPNTVLGVLSQDPIYSQTLVRWIKHAGLTQLYSSNPITLVVPAPYVFASVSVDYLNRFELPENRERLQKLLSFWVLKGYYPSNKLRNGVPLTTAFGQPIQVEINGTGAFVNGRSFYQVDTTATNGIIHTVSKFFEPKDIATLLAENGKFSSLVTALNTAGLTFPLTNTFTLFAPTDAAFSKVPKEDLKEILSDLPYLKATLLNHALGSKVLSHSIQNGTHAANLNGGQLLDFTVKDYLYVNGQRVSQTDIIAYNGVIHVVEGVLALKDIVQVAKDFGYNTFVSAVESLNLTSALKSHHHADRTVFIPTDLAFADLPASILANLSQPSSASVLAGVILYHVVQEKVYTNEFYSYQTLLTASADQLLTVTTNVSGILINNDALIIKPDIITSSGVIQVIDSVLLIRSVTDILSQSGQFNTLVTLLNSIGFSGLPSGGYFTLFAPTDAAFAALGNQASRIAADQAALNTVLKYHVVPGHICSSQFTNGLTLTTAQGSQATITLASGALPKVNQANIVFVDHVGSNGIIHFIDSVLVPKNVTLP